MNYYMIDHFHVIHLNERHFSARQSEFDRDSDDLRSEIKDWLRARGIVPKVVYERLILTDADHAFEFRMVWC